MSKGHLALSDSTPSSSVLSLCYIDITKALTTTASSLCRCQWQGTWLLVGACTLLFSYSPPPFFFCSFYSVASPLLSCVLWDISAPLSSKLSWESLIVPCIVLHHCDPPLQYLHSQLINGFSFSPMITSSGKWCMIQKLLVCLSDLLVNCKWCTCEDTILFKPADTELLITDQKLSSTFSLLGEFTV